jgi:hypothetical protein
MTEADADEAVRNFAFLEFFFKLLLLLSFPPECIPIKF